MKFNSRISKTFVLGTILGALSVALHAQSRMTGGGADIEKILQLGDALGGQNSMQKLPQTASTPSDFLIDDKLYIIGPGDVLQLQIVGAKTSETALSITPESSILLPRFGEISLRGKTLAEVKSILRDSITQRNPLDKAFITLLQPRTVLVSISGNVVNPGKYALSASMRASTAVQYAQGQIQLQSGNSQLRQPITSLKRPSDPNSTSLKLGSTQYFGNYSERFTTVLHADGTSSPVDALRASFEGARNLDPCLREGDEIFVPFDNPKHPTVSILGAVRRPSILPFRTGDNLGLLWAAGFGALETADTNTLYVSFPATSENKTISLSELRSQFARQITAGVSIVVPEKSSEQVQFVTVTGFVGRPGTYAIESGNTKISELIQKAGGITKDGAAHLAYIQRKSDGSTQSNEPEIDAARMAQYSSMSYLDTTRFRLDVLLKKNIVSCNIQEALTSPQSEKNITLESGDVIVIPRNQKNIYVYGQVKNPGFVPYTPGKRMQWYIQQAGGTAASAELDRARVIKGATMVWLEDDGITQIESGDQIFVPREREYPPGIKEQMYAVIAGLASTTVFLIVSLLNYFKK